jgi:hypothetical protein
MNSIQINLDHSKAIIESMKLKQNFKIIKTNKTRSSVYNENGYLQSFCPISSDALDNYFTDGKLRDNIRIEEYVEGTMINLFYDNKQWNISTKNNIGGENNFYINGNKKQTTFRKMFDDCCNDLNISINDFDESYIYSFVMQHVENRIINPVLKNNLYLISAYLKPTTPWPESLEMVQDITSFVKSSKLENVSVPIYYEGFTTKDQIYNSFAMPYTDYNIMGINLFDTEKGNRSKIRNPAYEELKVLRGNQAKIEYHYMTLRKWGRVDEFLDFFPEYLEDFNMFEAKIMNFKHELCVKYYDCYMKHNKPLREYDQQYKSHMFAIHDAYLRTKSRTDMSTISEYVETIPEASLMKSINYDYRVKV